MQSVRPAAVAGMFYPDDPTALTAAVHAYLRAATPGLNEVPKALIVPHAGYIYSGPVAAQAYAQLGAAASPIRRVVLLGPAHRVAVRGLALPEAQAFATPLGLVPVDAFGAAIAGSLPQVQSNAEAHAFEHSLEVQLPFLQVVLERFALVPLVVGSASATEVAEVLEQLWGGPETLIVVSSDLSHYHNYREAQNLDGATADAIVALRQDLDHEQACGATPVSGLLACARDHRLRAELLDLRNSGDTAGDRSRVVGYGAFAFYERANHGPN
ncbi:MAG: AmmeMemoRadiSam system protein B [Betaproteobacteria bacterium]|nr:AmmeMemoRadiSam system protein B [Betaproteobacteria bacterium]